MGRLHLLEPGKYLLIPPALVRESKQAFPEKCTLFIVGPCIFLVRMHNESTIIQRTKTFTNQSLLC